MGSHSPSALQTDFVKFWAKPCRHSNSTYDPLRLTPSLDTAVTSAEGFEFNTTGGLAQANKVFMYLLQLLLFLQKLKNRVTFQTPRNSRWRPNAAESASEPAVRLVFYVVSQLLFARVINRTLRDAAVSQFLIGCFDLWVCYLRWRLAHWSNFFS